MGKAPWRIYPTSPISFYMQAPWVRQSLFLKSSRGKRVALTSTTLIYCSHLAALTWVSRLQRSGHLGQFPTCIRQRLISGQEQEFSKLDCHQSCRSYEIYYLRSGPDAVDFCLSHLLIPRIIHAPPTCSPPWDRTRHDSKKCSGGRGKLNADLSYTNIVRRGRSITFPTTP